MSHAAILYLIAAPIGNLQDISLRALATLRQVPLVAAEDTRRARTLLSAHGIAGKKYLSLRAHNENHAAAQIVRHLQSGEDAAYLSDAGAPGVSDPGGAFGAGGAGGGMRGVAAAGGERADGNDVGGGHARGRRAFYGLCAEGSGGAAAFF